MAECALVSHGRQHSAADASVDVLGKLTDSLIISVYRGLVATFSGGITSPAAERFLTCHYTLCSCFHHIFADSITAVFIPPYASTGRYLVYCVFVCRFAVLFYGRPMTIYIFMLWFVLLSSFFFFLA